MKKKKEPIIYRMNLVHNTGNFQISHASRVASGEALPVTVICDEEKKPYEILLHENRHCDHGVFVEALTAIANDSDAFHQQLEDVSGVQFDQHEVPTIIVTSKQFGTRDMDHMKALGEGFTVVYERDFWAYEKRHVREIKEMINEAVPLRSLSRNPDVAGWETYGNVPADLSGEELKTFWRGLLGKRKPWEYLDGPNIG